MAHLAAWDQQGHYDSLLGPANKFTEQEFLTYVTAARKPVKKRMFEVRQQAAELLLSKGEEFALRVAPQVFTARGRDPKMLRKMKEDIKAMAPYFDDIRAWLGASSDWVAAMHLNLQAAYCQLSSHFEF